MVPYQHTRRAKREEKQLSITGKPALDELGKNTKEDTREESSTNTPCNEEQTKPSQPISDHSQLLSMNSFGVALAEIEFGFLAPLRNQAVSRTQSASHATSELQPHSEGTIGDEGWGIGTPGLLEGATGGERVKEEGKGSVRVFACPANEEWKTEGREGKVWYLAAESEGHIVQGHNRARTEVKGEASEKASGWEVFLMEEEMTSRLQEGRGANGVPNEGTTGSCWERFLLEDDSMNGIGAEANSDKANTRPMNKSRKSEGGSHAETSAQAKKVGHHQGRVGVPSRHGERGKGGIEKGPSFHLQSLWQGLPVEHLGLNRNREKQSKDRNRGKKSSLGNKDRNTGKMRKGHRRTTSVPELAKKEASAPSCKESKKSNCRLQSTPSESDFRPSSAIERGRHGSSHGSKGSQCKLGANNTTTDFRPTSALERGRHGSSERSSSGCEGLRPKHKRHPTEFEFLDRAKERLPLLSLVGRSLTSTAAAGQKHSGVPGAHQNRRNGQRVGRCSNREGDGKVPRGRGGHRRSFSMSAAVHASADVLVLDADAPLAEHPADVSNHLADVADEDVALKCSFLAADVDEGLDLKSAEGAPRSKDGERMGCKEDVSIVATGSLYVDASFSSTVDVDSQGTLELVSPLSLSCDESQTRPLAKDWGSIAPNADVSIEASTQMTSPDDGQEHEEGTVGPGQLRVRDLSWEHDDGSDEFEDATPLSVDVTQSGPFVLYERGAEVCPGLLIAGGKLSHLVWHDETGVKTTLEDSKAEKLGRKKGYASSRSREQKLSIFNVGSLQRSLQGKGKGGK